MAKKSFLYEVTTNMLKKMTDDGSRNKRSHIVFGENPSYTKFIHSRTIQAIIKKKAKSIDNKNNVSTLNNESDCQKISTAPCDHTSKYRTFSGYCNNLLNSHNGESFTTLNRLLPPEYDDYLSSPRIKSVLGYPLPNPRRVSLQIHTDEPTPDVHYTHLLMQWGQFIDHDFAFAPIHSGHNGSILDCSSCDSNRDHPACFPILIEKGDPYFTHGKCLPFTRSLPGQQNIGVREQLNQVTHYLDASMVYGSTTCQANKIRVEKSYLLRTSKNPLTKHPHVLKDLLPMTNEDKECRSADGQCFLAGDTRVNEQPGLTAFHTILVREHNYIGNELAQMNPHWDTEVVFQETRRIISAIVQHITFNEFLPRLLGLETVRKFSIGLLDEGYYNSYDENCSASLANEFTSAAFRLGHSMIRTNISLMTEDQMLNGHGGDDLPFRQHFFNPNMIRSGNAIDGLIRGLTMSPMEVLDNRISKDLKDHLFEETHKAKSGMDLPALNIQRARDHGIPGYNKYREFCGLLRRGDFHFEEIPDAWIEKLKSVYDHPDDIDLFPGLLTEKKLSGSVVGPTLACLVGYQFRLLRSCDRYWYESGDPLVRFTSAQLQSIRKVSLGGLLCRNCENPAKLPTNVFDSKNRLTNPMIKCEEREHLNLEFWRESPQGNCLQNGNTYTLGSSYFSGNYVCTCTKEGPVCQERKW